ncbi:hypothetical protein RRG08_048516 [Elysia crispata]|uniref:Uncharacterized protein n=1 Tax=Elysia crispata TaxID=231223 RepID=A0AAE1B6D5_9GAST|nr:hypothetical protein RRG08_048516 [Elysia crispata]
MRKIAEWNALTRDTPRRAVNLRAGHGCLEWIRNGSPLFRLNKLERGPVSPPISVTAPRSVCLEIQLSQSLLPAQFVERSLSLGHQAASRAEDFTQTRIL